MPPKAKFTREEIINAAFEIARVDGIKAVSARALGAKLGASARPIFSVFESMSEVHSEVAHSAEQLYEKYVESGLNRTDIPPFKGVGVQYIQFSIAEPKLFQMLFMSEQKEKPAVENVLPIIDKNYERILSSAMEGYQFNAEQAKVLYSHLWIYTHGIAALCATSMCSFTPEEIGQKLSEVCAAIVKKLKGEAKNDRN